MIHFLCRPKVAFTDGVIDLLPADLGQPVAELGFREVYDFYITPHGKKREAGQISVRIGEGAGIYYFGHIGYHIDAKWRGQHWSERACRLIRPLLEAAGKNSVVITTDPDNIASTKIIERLGCIPERTVFVPQDFRNRFEINAVKCRFIWHLQADLRID